MTDCDHRAFADWMAAHLGIADARIGPRLGGGNSNVTHLVETAQGKLILRRPPATADSSAAAGIQREFTILRAIEGRVPAPRAVAFCEDPSIIGQRFAITAFVPGLVVSSDLPDAYPDTPETLRQIGGQMVDALAALHTIDPQSAGVALPQRHGTYVERQIKRWLDVRARDAARELPLLFRLGEWLAEHRPATPAVSIIHGDFHLENALFAAAEPELAAVIDWELATIGDPMTDLGLFVMFWGPRPTDTPAFDWVQRSTRRGEIVSGQALAQAWSDATGLSIRDLDYYCCFAFWRLAAVVESAYVSFRRGHIDTAFARRLETDVPGLLAEAAARVGV